MGKKGMSRGDQGEKMRRGRGEQHERRCFEGQSAEGHLKENGRGKTTRENSGRGTLEKEKPKTADKIGKKLARSEVTPRSERKSPTQRTGEKGTGGSRKRKEELVGTLGELLTRHEREKVEVGRTGGGTNWNGGPKVEEIRIHLGN